MFLDSKINIFKMFILPKATTFATTYYPFATTAWVCLEGIMLSKISQRKTNTVLLKSLICEI